MREPAFGPILAGVLVLLLGLSAGPSPRGGAAAAGALPSRRALQNGSAFIFQRDTSSAVTVLGIVIGGGKAAEPEGQQGLAHLTTRLSLEITDEGKALDLMSQSTRLSTTVEEDYALILIESLSSHFEEALKTASEIILNPLFSGFRIDFIKESMAHQARLEQDDPSRAGRPAALRAFFGPSGYGASVFGNEQSLKAIHKDNIRGFYRDRFRTGNLSFIVVSDLEEAQIEGWLRKYFNKLPAGSPPPAAALLAPALREKENTIDKANEQTFVSFVFPLPALSLRTYALGSLLETGLGKGVGSKLWPLRSKARLAYNVGARATTGRSGGVLEALLETDASKTTAALETLETTLKDFAASGFNEDELRTTKAYAKADFLRDYEGKGSRVRILAFCEGTGLGLDAYNRFAELVDEVGLEEMNAFCRSVLEPSQAARVVIGPLR